MKLFNINDTIGIKITELGKKHWEEDFKKYAPDGYTFETHFNQYTKYGWTFLQMHVVMELFGAYGGMGMPSMFETNIKIDENHLRNL